MKSVTTLNLVKLWLVLVLLALSIGAIIADLQAQVTPGYAFEKETLLIALSGDAEAINKLRPALRIMWSYRFNIIEQEATTQDALINIGRQVSANKGVLIRIDPLKVMREEKRWSASMLVQVYFADIDKAEIVYSESMGVNASDKAKKKATEDAWSALAPVAGKISQLFSEKFPLGARIIDKTGRFVTFDIGRNAGVRRGARFDAFSGNRRVGLIEVIEVREKSAKAKILRWGSGIRVGVSVKERVYRPRWGISVTRSFLPAKGEAREAWEEPIDGASPYHFSIVWEEAANKRWIRQYSLGVSTLKLSESWEGTHVDCTASLAHDVIIPEVLYYSIGGGIGLGKTGQSKWVKEGTHYEGSDFFFMLDIFSGLSFRLGFIQISGDIGYIYFGGVGEESFKDEGGPSLSSGEFMYKDLSIGGFRTTAGLAVLF